MSQHLEALEKGNKIRLSRAAIRRELKQLPLDESREEAIRIIRDPDDLWKTAKLDYVLRMPRRTGPSFSRKVRQRVGWLAPQKPLATLTERQREAVIREMRRIRRKK